VPALSIETRRRRPARTPTCTPRECSARSPPELANYEAAESLENPRPAGATRSTRACIRIDLWVERDASVKIAKARDVADCPCWQSAAISNSWKGQGASTTTGLCGRNAVQIKPAPTGSETGSAELAKAPAERRRINNVSAIILLKFNAPGGDDGTGLEITAFPTRAIIKAQRSPRMHGRHTRNT